MRFYLGMLGVVVVCALVSVGFYIWYMHDINASFTSAGSASASQSLRQEPTTVIENNPAPTSQQDSSQQTSQTQLPAYQMSTIVIDGQAVSVMIADTPALQQLGLGNRSGLPADTGMLFVFQSDSKEAFWMKDMHFSLDMIWISASGQIVYMAQNVSPDTYPENFTPTSPARYVLEVPADYAVQHGWKVGDSVAFRAQ